MSRKIARALNRPPDAEGVRGRTDGRWHKTLAALFAAALFSGMLALTAAAQADRPRVDPGDPPPQGGGNEGWQVVNIPGLPAAATLGDVWVAPDGNVYVWATYPSPGTTAGVNEDGERLPNPRSDPARRSSTLFNFNGTTWVAALQTPGETGVTVFGATSSSLFASTTGSRGAANLYRFDGTTWVKLQMPGTYLGNLHTLAGAPNDLFFKVDRQLLHFDGARLTPMFQMPSNEAPVRGLVYMGMDGLFAMCPDGYFLYDNGVWNPCQDQIVFPNVQDSWGVRDAQNALHMYVLGANEHNDGVRLWQFMETNNITHEGLWSQVLNEPLGLGSSVVGSGLHLWGANGTDVYATGALAGEGRMYRYDGAAWMQLNPPQPPGVVHGVWGTQQGTVWFSTDRGQMIRYQRANRPPDIARAEASLPWIWPPDHRWVPMGVLGVVDPDGDAVTITFNSVSQDELVNHLMPGDWCPDAVLTGGRLYIRAERSERLDGRTYDIEFTATDRLGAGTTGHVTTCVPFDIGTPCHADLATFNSMGPCIMATATAGAFAAENHKGTLHVRYELEETSPVTLGVYDLLGRQRGTIDDGIRAPGMHETSWNLGALDPGVYFVKLRTKGPEMVRRVVVVR